MIQTVASGATHKNMTLSGIGITTAGDAQSEYVFPNFK